MALGMHSVHVPEVVAVFHLDDSEPASARAERIQEGVEALATGLATTLRDRVPNILIVGLHGSASPGAATPSDALSTPSAANQVVSESTSEALVTSGANDGETISEGYDPASEIISFVRRLKAMGINVRCDIDELDAKLSFMTVAEWEGRNGDMVEYEVTPQLPIPKDIWKGGGDMSLATEAGRRL